MAHDERSPGVLIPRAREAAGSQANRSNSAPRRPRAGILGFRVDRSAVLAAVMTAAFYGVVYHESMASSTIRRYTTEHSVEFVIVAFFMWGIADAGLRWLSYPGQWRAFRRIELPPRAGREPVSNAVSLGAYLQSLPVALRNSRFAQRLSGAFGFLVEQGSADGFGERLHQLAERDDDSIHQNYGLLRFIAWVMPVLGFLGTVVHFGTALGNFSIADMEKQLHLVVGAMGTAFDTTTVALAGGITMMFLIYLGERFERKIVRAIDRRIEDELLHRFERVDGNLRPLLTALEAASLATLRAVDASLERQIGLWEQALHTQRATAMAADAQRNDQARLLFDALAENYRDQRTETQATTTRLAEVNGNLVDVVQALRDVAAEGNQIVGLQTTLADNLLLLRETQRIDQALHGLTAAIHLLTAREQPSPRTRMAS